MSTSDEPTLKIREAIEDDLAPVCEITNWAIGHTTAIFTTEQQSLDHWRERWRTRNERHPWLVADIGGAVIGVALASTFLGRCGLTSAAEVTIYVAPDHQGRGVGKALYHRLISTVQDRGIRNLVAVISAPNPASERLHESFGFRHVGTLSRIGRKFDRSHDLTIWQLEFGTNDVVCDDASRDADLCPRTETAI